MLSVTSLCLILLYKVSLNHIAMRHKGNVNIFRQQRDRSLLRAYRELIGQTKHIALADVLERLVAMPTERFYVSEWSATIVIARMLKGDDLSSMMPNKRRMYEDILARVKQLMEDDGSLSLYDAVWQAVNQPAPQFYLTPASAKVILYNAKREERLAAKG